MSDDWYYVHQLTVLAGFRLIVLANRIGCENEFLLELHDKLAEGLACAIARLRSIMALELQLASETDQEGFTAFQLQGEEECFVRFRITLLDDLEIDYATYEYRINNGEWHYALSADCAGVSISYPSLSTSPMPNWAHLHRSSAPSAPRRASASASHASSTIDEPARDGFARLSPPFP
jgi:hypothetical protein